MIFSRSALASVILLVAVLTALTSRTGATAAADPVHLANRFSDDGFAFVNKHCVECHGEKDPKADLNLVIDKNADSIVKRRSVWENVVEMVSNGQMPPHEKNRPDQTEIDHFVGIINGLFDDVDLHAKPWPRHRSATESHRVQQYCARFDDDRFQCRRGLSVGRHWPRLR